MNTYPSHTNYGKDLGGMMLLSRIPRQDSMPFQGVCGGLITMGELVGCEYIGMSVLTNQQNRKYFKSRGPLTTEPSIQRTPFLFQAGTSTAGKDFAAKHAESIFLVGIDPQSVAKSARDIRLRAVEAGRDPAGIKLVAGILVIVDETDEKAQAKWEEYLSYVDLEGTATLFGGWTGTDLSQFGDNDDFRFTAPPAVQGLVAAWSTIFQGVKWTKRRVLQELALGGANPRVIGSPKTVADTLETWIKEGEIDGFNLSYVINPGDYEDIVKYLLPELRARGLVWDDYLASTARENFLNDGLGPRLRQDHPGSSYRWSSTEDTQA
jgi:alkanesulfonate monooxygenase SsuD/methylene tetrahydromethanopterin reductase-like flavin-dependent oxidoreductase (luciferase family)